MPGIGSSGRPEHGCRSSWPAVTHDWGRDVDEAHLALVRAAPHAYAPGGWWHLVLEVLAYAADEADDLRSGRARITLGPGRLARVADQGRGTDTRLDRHGHAVKKPIMATRDLRFFDDPGAAELPDGHPRRGISVVAALSTWLEHTNRRRGGSWTQRYRHGRPVTGLVPIDDDATTGTTVSFRPAPSLGVALPPFEAMRAQAHALSPRLDVVIDRVDGGGQHPPPHRSASCRGGND